MGAALAIGAVAWIAKSFGVAFEPASKLGLRRLNQTVEHDDSPALRGMIAKVGHLVDVRDEEAGEAS